VPSALVVGGIQESVTLAAYILYALKKHRKKSNNPKYTLLYLDLALNMVILPPADAKKPVSVIWGNRLLPEVSTS